MNKMFRQVGSFSTGTLCGKIGVVLFGGRLNMAKKPLPDLQAALLHAKSQFGRPSQPVGTGSQSSAPKPKPRADELTLEKLAKAFARSNKIRKS